MQCILNIIFKTYESIHKSIIENCNYYDEWTRLKHGFEASHVEYNNLTWVLPYMHTITQSLPTKDHF